MRVLVACEFSGRVRDAFRRRGHVAVSCDLLPTEAPGPHYQGDVFDILNDGWDMMIMHPPCTHLSLSGARCWPQKRVEQAQAINLVFDMLDAPIPRIAMENPIGKLSTVLRKPDQIIQPWQFGHGEVKATCLWLYGLPKLVPTNIVSGREARILGMAPGPDRAKKRSITYQGIATAMAEQWG